MRIIPVLDLRRGQAVHARGGARDTYAPVRSRLAAAEGDALELARVYREQLGATELYVADLDAILGTAPQSDLLRQLADSGATPWVDAGVGDAAAAAAVARAGAARVIVGLETLPAMDALGEIIGVLGTARVVFSLDLRAGRPLARHPALAALDAEAVAAAVVAAGARTIIALDLARVGASAGPSLDVVRALRRAHPALELVAGGGVRDRADLDALARAGADAALVATAIHDGRL